MSEFDQERPQPIELFDEVSFDRLGIEDLLRELLDRVRKILAADTAVVLLAEGASGVLVPAATSGLDMPHPPRSRIPHGHGFAGRIAVSRAPMVLDDIDADEIVSPALRGAGVRSLLGIPLEASGQLLGVLHVGRRSAGTFTTEDTLLLQRVAEQMALATQARLSAEERAAAITLQRSLLPERLPDIPGLDVAARYIPGDGIVGGDWYDVLVLPDGAIGIVMGDVAGHGLRAAVIMGRLRSALRAYAIEHADPAQALHLLDVKINHFEAGAMATVVYLRTRPPYEQATLSTAGHLQPMRIEPSGKSELVELPVDLPLGVDVSHPRHSTVIDFAAGESLCLFTDGLVESHKPAPGSQSQVDRGLARLADALTPGDAGRACACAIDALIAAEPLADDVAILVMHRPPCR